jgi:glycogen debranching enzyme GlgX
VNFAVVSRHATAIDVCLYEEAGEQELYRFRLPHRLGDVHYGFIAGVGPGTRYGLRADGPWDEARGHYFDTSKLLVDPYATELDRPFHHTPELLERGADTGALVPKAIVRADVAPARPLPPAPAGFIYELSVKAFTKLHPQVPEAMRGTVRALAEPAVITHLTGLGVDTVELMPLMAWIDERHLTALGLSNGWGYNPVVFMAPDPRLAPGGFAEIRAAVEALHAVNIRVVLDVVFNHTGESDEGGTTLSLGGLDNTLYYRFADGRLVNDTGCGNTLACDRAPVVQLIMDAMRRWVNETGLDGFRYDLATTLARTDRGFTPDAPLLGAIQQDPLLKNLIHIAEPWDVGLGGYQLGRFPAGWAEWSDRYRDDVRRFWRGDPGSAGALATRLSGSSDIFAPHRRPQASVNFIAAHDGFTLADLVTYRFKNNFANGENNNDGNGDEVTWQGGDVRALLATLFLSRGSPMLTAGDEFGRSQRGNNNAYAQDNALTWLDWAKADRTLVDYVAGLSRLRKSLPPLRADRFLTGAVDPRTSLADADWRGADGGAMNWQDGAARVIGLVLSEGADRIAIWINGNAEARAMPARPRDGYRWLRLFASAAGDGLPPRSVSLYTEERVPKTGIDDDTLRALAAAAGIERDWWEVDGTHHDVPPDTLRHILSGLGIAHQTPDDARAANAALAARQRLLIGRAGVPIEMGAAQPHRRRLRVKGDDGHRSTHEIGPGQPASLALPHGLYEIENEDGGQCQQVIVSPGACYLPEDIARGRRVYGLAAHLYALRHAGDGGIGDFETLRRFADVTHDLGGRYAGLNPLHHMFPSDRTRVSPYQPSDRHFLDPIYISIDQLLAGGRCPGTARLAASSSAAFAALEKLSAVDYAAHWQAKSALLERAFAEFKGDDAFEAFIAAGGDRLHRHGAFEAERAGEKPTASRIRYRAFLEYVADAQLASAARRRVLYRDLALGCAFDGGEIAEDPQAFVATVSLGAPPDPFARQGQVWNLPALSPLELVARGLAPLQAVLAANMRHAAALRIDHILGFARQFWVPRGAEGSQGAYVRFPMPVLIALAALESHRHQCLVVGEDLGTIPDGLREALNAANILSYKVLWFEREGAGFKPPGAYPSHALACLASHDLPTFVGWRRGRDISMDRELGFIGVAEAEKRAKQRADEIAALDRMTGNRSAADEEASIAAHGFVASAPSAIMLIQADDLAGETEPLNVPGTDAERPNWRRRIGLAIEELAARPLTLDVVNRVREERPVD